MAATLDTEQVQLLKGKHLAQFVTLMKDGSPHIAPVWIDSDGKNVLVNSQDGRVKIRNIRRDPRVAVAMLNAENPYSEVVNIRGTVTGVTTEGATEHINYLSERYTGVTPYQRLDPDHPRLIITIRPDRIY